MSTLFKGATPFLAVVLTGFTELGAQAQTAPAVTGAPAVTAAPVKQLETVTVTTAPTGTAASNLSGDSLLLRAQGSLGETLNGLPGISSTYFGPNASRPVIRGQDGDRVKILNNSGATVDVSGLSFDHATPVDVLTAERIEVLRGPATLLFGGGAIGGLVNIIDSKIAREPLSTSGPYQGKFDVGFASGGNAKNAGFALDAGTKGFVWHADASSRSSDDVNVPIALPCTRVDSIGLAKRICNSAGRNQTASLGASLVGRDGYLGSSISRYTSQYGTVAEDNVEISMKSRRLVVDGELRGAQLPPFLKSIRAQVSQNRYQHTEFDEGVAGTVFSNRGQDYRVEAKQNSVQLGLGKFSGVIGLQGESTRFSADGDEAFVPYTRSTSHALFTYQELGLDWGKLSAGLRLERSVAQSLGSPTTVRFIAGQQKFNLVSYAIGVQSAGVQASSAPSIQWSVNAGVAQRAPKDYELYADGTHIATNAYELGDANLRREVSRNIELGLKWTSGAHKATLALYSSRFSNYVFLDGRLGNFRNKADGSLNPIEDANNPGFTAAVDAFEPLPEFRYVQVKARFTGIEVGGVWNLLASTASSPNLDLLWRADVVRATNLTLGEPLPRIAPARFGATLAYGQGPIEAQLGFDRSTSQNRVAAGQNPTKGYTLWNASLSWKAPVACCANSQLNWYLRVDNLTNQLAYSASSILTQTAPGKSPLPGRSIQIGMRVNL